MAKIPKTYVSQSDNSITEDASTMTFTRDREVADLQSIEQAIDALDGGFYELSQVGAGNGVTKVGLTTGRVPVGVANIGAELNLGGTAGGVTYGNGAGVVAVGTIQNHAAITPAGSVDNTTATMNTETCCGFVRYEGPLAAELVSIKAALQVADGACAIVGQPDYPRGLTVDLAAGAAITAGDLTIVGVNASGIPTTEVVSLITAVPVAIPTLNGFATVTSATVAGLAGGAGMTLSIGCAATMALPANRSPVPGTFDVYKTVVDGANEAVAGVNAVYGLVAPTTAANNAHNYDFFYTYQITPTQAAHTHAVTALTVTPGAHVIS